MKNSALLFYLFDFYLMKSSILVCYNRLSEENEQ